MNSFDDWLKTIEHLDSADYAWAIVVRAWRDGILWGVSLSILMIGILR